MRQEARTLGTTVLVDAPRVPLCLRRPLPPAATTGQLRQRLPNHGRIGTPPQ